MKSVQFLEPGDILVIKFQFFPVNIKSTETIIINIKLYARETHGFYAIITVRNILAFLLFMIKSYMYRKLHPQTYST